MQPRARVLSALAIAATVVGLLETGLVATGIVDTGGSHRDPNRPTATWRFGSEEIEVRPFDEVPAFDAMSLHLDLPFDGYVYVVAFDHLQGTVCYYPSEFLDTDHDRDAKGDGDSDAGPMHHLGSGHHDLPGTLNGGPQKWWVPDVTGALSLCVVVSRRPITDLEQRIPLMKQVGNKAFSTRTMGYYMPRAGRDKVIGKRQLPHEVLVAAQNQPGSVNAGQMVAWDANDDVFLKVLNIRPGKPRAGSAAPTNPFQKQLRKMVEDKRGKQK